MPNGHMMHMSCRADGHAFHVTLQTVHQARIEQANGSGRAVTEERVLPDHKASLKEKDAELQVTWFSPSPVLHHYLLSP